MPNKNEKHSAAEDTWHPLTGADKKCFACGFENPHGLQMKFETDGTRLRSLLMIPEKFRGWSNLIHGGILSTILDETMSWTAIYLTGKFILTKNMRINFIKPARIGMKLISTGRIEKTLSERKIIVAAEIRCVDDKIYASSEGEFVLFNREQFLKLQIIQQEDLGSIADLIQRN